MNTIPTPTAVEKMDHLNLRPALEFVARYGDIYERFVRYLIHKPSAPVGAIVSLTTLEEDLIADSVHITGIETLEILSRLPPAFQELSMLDNINYHFAGIVYVPIFEESGEWKGAVDMVDEAKFPRLCSGDHPHRILIGRSDGVVIFPSALPVSIHESIRTRWLYQLHVMLHEFFHTIEFMRRDHVVAEKVILCDQKDNTYTFRDWWKKWEDLFTSTTRPLCPTRYAQTYADFLTLEVCTKDPGAFVVALAEQVAESFVGYIIGIVPNDQGYSSFKNHSPEAWALIHELATSRVLKIS